MQSIMQKTRATSSTRRSSLLIYYVAVIALLLSAFPSAFANEGGTSTHAATGTVATASSTAPPLAASSSSSSSTPSSSPASATPEPLSAEATAAASKAASIQSLLQRADAARFGGSVSPSAPSRPSVHSYPSHSSLQASIQADRARDMPAAIALYEESADLGSSQALNDLGEIYLYGEGGLSPNYTLAAEYFNRSADLGNAEAQHNIAVMQSLGLNEQGKPDEALAMVHDYFSAMGENPLAKLTLGYRHLFGIQAPKSCDGSVAYYVSVSEAVVAQSLASPIQGVIEKARLTDEKSRSVAPEEDEDVVQYYQHSAENGDVGAQVALGQLHLYGARGFEQNPERAARYFKAAAAQGDASAQSSLGQMYVQGVGVTQNNETAFQYLSQAAEKNNAAAQNGLGYLYLHGQGTKQDYKLALKWFKKSADQGNAEAQFNLGAMYFAGLGVDKKYATALQYFTMASHYGHTRALFNLGQMHLNGLGTIKSCAIGVKLHKSVAERGNWATVCNEAHRNFLKGNYELAWMQYARAAEEGYEVAQVNSAYMLDQGLGFLAAEAMLREHAEKRAQSETATAASCSSDEASASSCSSPLATSSSSSNSPSNLRYTLAHRHWQMAAQQGNVEALRMLGDYAFEGLVTGAPDYKAAMKYYNQAAEHRNAQSMFNLGYMHEHGLGVNAPDVHLAKRFYDSCLETDPDALVPVKLALAKLYAKQYWQEWIEMTDATAAEPSATGTSATPAISTTPPVVGSGNNKGMAPLPSPMQWMHKQLEASGLSHWFAKVWNAPSIVELFLSMEDVILAILCAILAIIVYYRSQR